jgi:glyoxylase I family protein
MSDIRGYTHVSLSVSNLDRSSSFYSKVLGLPVLVEVLEGAAFDGHEQIFRVGRSALCLQEHRDNLGSDFEPSRTGLDHLSLEVPTIESLHAWGERLTAAGVEHSGVKPLHGFGDFIEFRDPDGIQLELHCLGRSSDEKSDMTMS